jgi:Fe-Mn family superoxide dismutase
MAQDGAGVPPDGSLLRSIEAQFGSFASFREAFVRKAVGNFGAGWT